MYNHYKTAQRGDPIDLMAERKYKMQKYEPLLRSLSVSMKWKKKKNKRRRVGRQRERKSIKIIA